ncbi:MAG: Rpn family recombination-promoting nuclease/putative transposase [Bacteroidales bacterium]|nr:Rpn family recombination-promoting nuclease/putative transposase [Bacteroidales bacterium]
MGRFINPFTDTGFKILFGQEISKPLLIDFLNNLLKDQDEIIDLKFLDKERPRIHRNDRGLIYDIYCETANHKKIIVEMQNRSQKYFVERSIYYVSQAVSRQGQKGYWDYNFDSVYFVAFMNFKLDSLPEFRTDVALLDTKTHKVITDKIKFIYLQLPYFTKEEDGCKTNFERWIYIFKNMDILERIPWAAKNSVFARLGELAEIANMTERQRRKYDQDLKILRDTKNILDFAIEEGIEKGMKQGMEKGMKQGMEKGMKQGMEKGIKEGREKGIAEGIAEGINSMILSMHINGIPIEQIAAIANISMEDVQKIIEQTKH